MEESTARPSAPGVGLTIAHDARLLGRRDAFHVPAILAISLEPMRPGQRVEFDLTVPGGSLQVVVGVDDFKDARGIVDPFVPYRIKTGEMFWVWLIPGAARGLRHEFEVDLNVLRMVVDESLRSDPATDDDQCKDCY
jgi:hypothetical protein